MVGRRRKQEKRGEVSRDKGTLVLMWGSHEDTTQTHPCQLTCHIQAKSSAGQAPANRQPILTPVNKRKWEAHGQPPVASQLAPPAPRATTFGTRGYLLSFPSGTFSPVSLPQEGQKGWRTHSSKVGLLTSCPEDWPSNGMWVPGW